MDVKDRYLFAVRYIYGLNKSMSRWNGEISNNLKLIVFFPSKVYQDLCIQDYGYHYEYITIYSDEIVDFIKDPTRILSVFDTLFQLK